MSTSDQVGQWDSKVPCNNSNEMPRASPKPREVNWVMSGNIQARIYIKGGANISVNHCESTNAKPNKVLKRVTWAKRVQLCYHGGYIKNSSSCLSYHLWPMGLLMKKENQCSTGHISYDPRTWKYLLSWMKVRCK